MDDIKLISLVEGQDILYNKKRNDFKDQNKKCNAWQYIADSLEQEVEYVKSRWLCLRQRFSRERSKLASGADEWKLMKYMRFLDPVVAVRRTTSNYKNAKQAKCSGMENSNKITETLQPLEEIYLTVSDDDVASDSCDTLTQSSFSLTSGTSRDDGDLVVTPTVRSSANPKKRSTKSSIEEPPQKQMFTALPTTLQGMNTLMAKEQGSTTADSDDIFGQFIASRLKLMGDAEKNQKIKDIFNIIMS
ncbi:uncharacterized protein CBL_11594 [Carabus blaptoides fortunei]